MTRSGNDPRIYFGQGVSWVAVNCAALERDATDVTSPDSLGRRIKYLAEARCNHVGHTHLNEGDLGRILRKANRRSGEIRDSPPNRISDGLAEAKERGWIDKSSTPCLLIVPLEVVQQGRGSRKCPVCQTRRTGL